MSAFILLNEHETGDVYRVAAGSIVRYRQARKEDGMGFGSVVFFAGGARLLVKESARDIDGKICRVCDGPKVEMIQGVNF